MPGPHSDLSPVGGARSLLFVPGDRPDRYAKAAATAADLVIIDLEDAVPEEHKSLARDAAARWLAAGGSAAVRVNGTTSTHHDQDVQALSGLPGLQAVVAPMSEDPDALTALHERLGPDVEILALVETALGVLRAVQIATTPGVSRLAFGNLDFAADISASPNDEAMLLARSSLVLASRAAGLPGPVDGVTTALDNPALARADATRAHGLGFAGKLCIHPTQVDSVNAAFTPSDQDLTWARRILQALDGGGAARVDGHMVDAPVAHRARAILARAGEGR